MSLVAACCFAVAIDAHAIRAHMTFLAGDLLEGRGTATRGYDIAAAYIAAQFEAVGLETSMQQVPLRHAVLDAKASRVEAIAPDGTRTPLVFGRDYVMRANVSGTTDFEVPASELRRWKPEESAIVLEAAALPVFEWREPKTRATVWLAPTAIAERVHIVSTNRVTQTQSPNVIGLLRGETNELVVITAHADHLGIGEPVNGDAIYNGAVDNASGVATLIELARACAAMKERPKRSLLFIAFTAEEPGSIGSDYFVHHPTVPFESIVANINIDGSAMWAYDAFVLRGPEHALFRRAVEASGVKVAPDPFPDRFPGSDHYSFHQRGIPAILVTTARSGEARAQALAWFRTRYHRPSDDLQQPLDYEAAAQFTRELLFFVRALTSPGSPASIQP